MRNFFEQTKQAAESMDDEQHKILDEAPATAPSEGSGRGANRK
jgi:hypothetical protein